MQKQQRDAPAGTPSQRGAVDGCHRWASPGLSPRWRGREMAVLHRRRAPHPQLQLALRQRWWRADRSLQLLIVSKKKSMAT